MNDTRQNLDLLQKYHPLVYKQCLPELNQPVSLHQDATGLCNIPISTPEGRQEWLYSEKTGDEIRSLPQQIRALQNPCITVWFGLGLGYHLVTYLENPHPLNEHIIVFEPSITIFKQFLQLCDRSSLFKNPKIIWMVGIPPEELATHLLEELNRRGAIEDIQQHVSIEWGYRTDALEKLKVAWTNFVTLLTNEMNIRPIDAQYGLLNFSKNWKEVQQSPLLENWKNLFHKKPGVVISTGPSLNHCIPSLKSLSQKAVLFAVDSALPLLNEAGVFPHFTGCLERLRTVVLPFRKSKTERTILCTTPVIHPDIYETFKGPRLHISQTSHFLPWLYPQAYAFDEGMGSVSHLALFVLHWLGCRPIYLVGQDLAFDPFTKKTHACGYGFEQEQKDFEKIGFQSITVPANNGGKIESMDSWVQFAGVFTLMIQKNKIECFNVIPKNYGMKITGTIQKEPDDVFVSHFHENFDPDSILQKKISGFHPDNETSIREVIHQTCLWLDQKISASQNLLRQFYQQFGPQNFTVKTKEDLALLETMEETSSTWTREPFWVCFLGILAQGKHLYLTRQSLLLGGAPAKTHEDQKMRLSIPLRWYSETLLRAVMAKRLIQKMVTAHEN